jgi:peptidyl-prolyl cis-trans isomerase B (cyclophilin B)
VASSRNRRRQLARAKLDRQMARRAAALRRKRRIQAAVGVGLAAVLLGLGSAWALGAFDSKPKAEATDVCAWTPQNPEANSNAKDVGMPPTTGLPTTGSRPMIITTDQGSPITVDLDVTGAPCASASFAYLASKNFYDNTKCHEITTDGALHCGDPSGTNQGGPTYTFASENLPAPLPSDSPTPPPGSPPLYPKGTVALYPNPPGADGSQFLIFFKDASPAGAAFPIVGHVTSGLDVVEKIGKIETVDNGSGAKVKPKTDVTIQSLTVGEVATPAASGGATPEPSATASAGASSSPTSAS